jgi:hypothetical protein
MRKVILCTSIILLIAGCGSTKPHSKRDVPKWYLNPPKDKNKFYAVGDAMRPQLSLSKKIATSRARDELARMIKTEVRSKLNDYQKASGLGMEAEASEFTEYVSGNVVNMSLEYSLIEQTDIRGGRVFVMVSYDAKAAAKAAKEAAKASASSANAYRSELEARDAFSRLDAEIDKLEGRTGRAPGER